MENFMARIHTQPDGTKIIRDDWSSEDIQSVAENMDVVLTQAQIDQVMDIVVEAFDANVGINWDSFETAIEMILGETT
jgi:hypothetical protein